MFPFFTHFVQDDSQLILAKFHKRGAHAATTSRTIYSTPKAPSKWKLLEAA